MVKGQDTAYCHSSSGSEPLLVGMLVNILKGLNFAQVYTEGNTRLVCVVMSLAHPPLELMLLSPLSHPAVLDFWQVLEAHTAHIQP